MKSCEAQGCTSEAETQVIHYRQEGAWSVEDQRRDVCRGHARSIPMRGHGGWDAAFATVEGRPMIENFRRQYEKNLASLRTMLTQAEAIAPRKYRGYTVEQLATSVARFEAIVAMSDEQMQGHIAGTRHHG